MLQVGFFTVYFDRSGFNCACLLQTLCYFSMYFWNILSGCCKKLNIGYALEIYSSDNDVCLALHLALLFLTSLVTVVRFQGHNGLGEMKLTVMVSTRFIESISDSVWLLLWYDPDHGQANKEIISNAFPAFTQTDVGIFPNIVQARCFEFWWWLLISFTLLYKIK